jgi:hypothetical protein
MRHAIAVVVILVAVSSTPAFAQFDTRRMEHIEEQALLRQGRAFAVGVGAKLPVAIVGIHELRQPDGRARFAVTVKNVSQEPVPAYTVSAAVVGNDGKVKAWQPLAPVKQLKPGQSRRQELTVRVAVPALTDYIAFAVAEVEPASGEAWKAVPTDLEEAIGKASTRISSQR